MKIGLINIEPKIFNTAYMQIAAFHKERNVEVGWWSPLTDGLFDYVYCSSLFDFTDKREVPKRAICGGTGYDVQSLLSVAIQESELEYNIYPKCDRSYVWFSRGCIRNCPWCVVPEKEGKIKPVEPKNLNPRGKFIVVEDNNFFANPFWPTAINRLQCWNQPVVFDGIDVRLLDEEKCRALLTLKHHKQIKIAWDDPDVDLEPQIKKVIQWIKPWRLMCYVLIGFNSTEEQDLYRVETLRSLGIDPFVMPYDKSDLYQRAFARWVNHKTIFKSVKWEDYKYRVYKQEEAGTGWKRS